MAQIMEQVQNMASAYLTPADYQDFTQLTLWNVHETSAYNFGHFLRGLIPTEIVTFLKNRMIKSNPTTLLIDMVEKGRNKFWRQTWLARCSQVKKEEKRIGIAPPRNLPTQTCSNTDIQPTSQTNFPSRDWIYYAITRGLKWSHFHIIRMVIILEQDKLLLIFCLI